jgi:hypothetical protein
MILTEGSRLSGWQVGSTRQGKRGRWHVPFREWTGWAVAVGQTGPLGPFIFSFFFFFLCILFYFHISLISFAEILQTRSNQILKFSKIQKNITKQ